MEKKMANSNSDPSTRSESFKMSYSTTKPSWLTSTLSELDQRMKSLAINQPEGENTDHSFKERADFYYEKRPQLIELLQDLYNGYVALSDKYTQSLLKQNHQSEQSSVVSFIDDDFFSGREDGSSVFDSDIDSSLSCHHHHHQPLALVPHNIKDGNDIVTDLVMKNVMFNIIIDEVTEMERQHNESLSKIELQKSLLDVLESERLILLNENAQLCAQVITLAQENKRLSSESLSVKRKASKMARLLLKMRDEQKIDMVRKIEDLQGKIQMLEKENESCEQLVNKEQYDEHVNKESCGHSMLQEQQVKAEKSKRKGRNAVSQIDLQICLANKRKNFSNMKYNSAKKGSIWWEKMKNVGMF